jgi:hypothetical protein
MTPKRREILMLVAVLSFAANIFLTGINWGLPSRKVDPFLFGKHPVWSGQQIAHLAGERNPSGNVGADVDVNPISRQQRPIVANQTDQQRAEIVRRYRLFTYQPDEMITMMSLSTIKQNHGDPRLYQYGGLWIYPVGVMLKVASMVHFIDLRSDQTYYLDHPEAFGRLYIVARLYTVMWAVVGAWTVYWLAKKMSGDLWLGLAACTCYALMPIVINMSHEAKPHLPGAVLTLVAIIAATKYVESGASKWAVWAGVFCGAAFGMVLTGVLSFIILPFMVLERWRSPGHHPKSQMVKALVVSIASFFAVYCITNPFVVIHFLGDRTILNSNLGNSQDMYRAPLTRECVMNAIDLVGQGASPLLAGVGAIVGLLSLRKPGMFRSLLFMPALLIAAEFVLLANGKPAEYARFAIFLDIALMLAAIVGLGKACKKVRLRIGAIGLLIISTGVFGAGYFWHFGRDSYGISTRQIDAMRMDVYYRLGARELAIYSDPAPYCLPPVNLFDWNIVLIDRGAAPGPNTDVLIKPVDLIPPKDPPMREFQIDYWTRPRLLPTPISWAAKPFRVIVKTEFTPASR